MVNYSGIFFFFTLAIVISVALVVLSYFFAFQNLNKEKISPYECGFEPFEDARQPFQIRFFLIAILFIIFDLEISFLFPWSLGLNLINNIGFISMLFFLIILTSGLIYEWMKGGLEWY